MSDRSCACNCGASLAEMRADALYHSEACEKRHKRRNSTDKAPTGVGSRGGNVRDLDTARELQGQVKDKRDWRDAIDEQIRLTLLETGYFHADDLDEIRIPPEHAQLKGTRSAWFRNQGFMEKTGAERKVAHKAANGRKAPIHRITPKGRRELTAGVGARGERSDSSRLLLGSACPHPGVQSAPTGAPSPQGSDRSSNPPVPSASATDSPAVESSPKLAAGESIDLQGGRDHQVRGAGSSDERGAPGRKPCQPTSDAAAETQPARLPEAEPLSLFPGPDPESWAA